VLQELRLKNFQKHRDLKLVLSPGVTAIIGASDTGKSAIVRALRWVVEHKPITGLQTHETEDTRVGIKTDAGIVIRFKDKKEYGYSIDGKKFLATGTIQPVGVKQILGLESINFQGQHDPVFLLTMTPGQMAKELNRIVNLGAIDVAMAEIGSRITKAKNAVGVWEAEVKKNQKLVDGLSWALEADSQFFRIETLVQEFETATEKSRELKLWISGVEEVWAKIEILQKRQNALAVLVNQHREYKNVFDKAQSIRSVQQRFSTVRNFEQLELAAAELLSLRTRCEETRKAIFEKTANRTRLHTLLTNLQKLALDLLAADTQKLELEEKIKEIPVCPSCNRPL